MENGRIRLRSEDGELELEVLEETVLQGQHYILAADTEGEEDGSCYIMKDISPEDAEEASYVLRRMRRRRPSWSSFRSSWRTRESASRRRKAEPSSGACADAVRIQGALIGLRLSQSAVLWPRQSERERPLPGGKSGRECTVKIRAKDRRNDKG